MYLIAVANVSWRTRHLYIVPGENSTLCALDAYEVHQRVYGGDEDLRMIAVELPASIDGPVELMKLD